MTIIKFLLIVVTLGAHTPVLSQNFEKWQAEARMKGSGEGGTILFDIFPTSKRYSKLEIEAKKMAVYAVLFLGIDSLNKSLPSFSPFFETKDILTTERDFFKKFFSKNGPYLKYVSLVQTAGQFELIKVRGRGWKMGYTVSVYNAMLYEDLKNAKILK